MYELIVVGRGLRGTVEFKLAVCWSVLVDEVLRLPFLESRCRAMRVKTRLPASAVAVVAIVGSSLG